MDASLLCLSETWLSADVCDNELFLSNYTIHRSDRNFLASGKSRGGGVLFAHRNDMNSTRISLSKYGFPTEIDIVCATVTTLSCNMTFIVIYIPPNVTQLCYDDFMERLSLLCTEIGEQLIIVGDFNTPHFQYPCEARSKSLAHFVEYSSLTQVSTITNSLNRMLDLVFTNLNCSVSRSDFSLVAEDSLHPTLLLELSFPIDDRRCETNTANPRLNFRRADFPNLYSAISTTDWAKLTTYSDVNSMCDCFYTLLMESIHAHVPTRIPKRNQFPSWFTPELINMIKLKDRARRYYIRHKSKGSYSVFSSYRSQVKGLICTTYSNFIKHSENSIQSHPNNFWRFINLKRQSSRIPGEMSFNGSKLNTPQSIVDHFAEYFASVYPQASNMSQSYTNLVNNSLINTPELSETDIIKSCMNLKSDLSCGPDNIPSLLVRDCAHVFAVPLAILYNFCIQSGSFPDRWKMTNICPILKDGNRADITNYRPISIISNFSKVFEKAIISKLHFDIYNKLSIHQHGFFRGRSTTTNLVCITQFISEVLDRSGQVDVIYTDFAKAFDKVDHRVLLHKLQLFGFTDILVRFFSSYLKNRTCSVTYNGFTSMPFTATSGVPQGSVLGPTLFLIFINDLALSLNCHRLFFADDLKIFSSISCIDDCQSLQLQLQQIDSWCITNKLMLNVNKCKVVSYARSLDTVKFNYMIGNSQLAQANDIRDLGVTFDTKLRFNLHVETKVKAASRMLGFIMRTCKDLTNLDCIKLLFNTFVRPVLEYAATVWNPYYKCYVDLLENVQRKFLKYLYFKKYKSYPLQGYPQTELLMEFGYLSLESRRSFFDIKFLNKILRGSINIDRFYIHISLVQSRENARFKQLFYVPCANTNLLVNSPIVRACRLANKCYPSVNITTVLTSELNVNTIMQLLN